MFKFERNKFLLMACFGLGVLFCVLGLVYVFRDFSPEKLYVVLIFSKWSYGKYEKCLLEPMYTSTVQCSLCSCGRNDQFSHSLETRENLSDSNINCDKYSKYRTLDGSCNNLRHPMWAKSNTPFIRFLSPVYSDNNYTLRLSTKGKHLPLARTLSTSPLISKLSKNDHISLLAVQWAQVIAHDLTISDSATLNIDCCNLNTKDFVQKCLPIIVPLNDDFYSEYDVSCINEIRTRQVFNNYCGQSTPAQQINANTHIIDASLVYGSSLKVANSLREFQKGKLKHQISKDGREFLPNTLENIESQCFIECDDEPCYTAGDVRVNQNTHLSVLQNILLREHNRIAVQLSYIHEDWDDETLYQETRRIVIAIVQHIIYKQLLHLYIGENNMIRNNLYPLECGYTQYNSKIKPIILNSFATAAFRFVHSGIQAQLKMFSSNHKAVDSIHLVDWMTRPLIVQKEYNFDKLLRGLTQQPMLKFKNFYDKDITTKLFHSRSRYGQDLLSLDIERGRDHGLPPYIHFLEITTGRKVNDFEDLDPYISGEHIDILKQFYYDVKDIDLFVGGLLENHVKGTRFGPTFLTIVTEQFYRLKWGDRFWYEVGNSAHSFSVEQLEEIRKITFSALICNNGDNITSVAKDSFKPVSILNPLVPCKDIQRIDLTKW